MIRYNKMNTLEERWKLIKHVGIHRDGVWASIYVPMDADIDVVGSDVAGRQMTITFCRRDNPRSYKIVRCTYVGLDWLAHSEDLPAIEFSSGEVYYAIRGKVCGINELPISEEEKVLLSLKYGV